MVDKQERPSSGKKKEGGPAKTKISNETSPSSISAKFGLRFVLFTATITLLAAIISHQYDGGEAVSKFLRTMNAETQIHNNSDPVDTKDSVDGTTATEQSSTPANSDEPPSKHDTLAASSAVPRKEKLNRIDKTIKGKLELGKHLLEADKLEEAKKMFSRLVETHPYSPRSHFLLGQTLFKLAERERSNGILDEGIGILKRAMVLPDVYDDLYMDIGVILSGQQTFRGSKQGCIETLKKLTVRFPDNLDLEAKLGVAHLQNEAQYSSKVAAREIFEDILEKEPNNAFAMAHLGFIYCNHEHDPEKAAPLLVGALNSNDERVTSDSRFYYHAGDSLYRIGQREQASQVFQHGADKGIFLSSMQRSLINVDGLAARPWWEKEQLPQHYIQFLQALTENWQVIRDEGMAQISDETGLFKGEDENLRENGDWKQLTIFARGQRKPACEHTPETCKLIAAFPDAARNKRGQVKYSLMFPGTHIWPHCGPTNCRLRPHLGLKVPGGAAITVGGETRAWTEGEFIILDDSFEHEVWHNGTEPRLILIVDLWHPDLTHAQKQSLSPI